ncbi:MAG TPA: ABC transporter substrate-binding protein [Acidimicrobiales bacterium]|nr:ABC transporter substrate-binding protein [Acidimicrobiales bacterium]
MFNAVFAAVNKAGGAACRTLVPKFYDDQVASASSEQATCLQIQQDGDFAVLQNLYNPQEFNCLAQRNIPNIFYTSPHSPLMKQFFPYVMGVQPDYDRLIKDYIFGAQKLGLLSGQKIGILEQTCYPDENTDIQADLSSISVKVTSVYNFGCVTSGASEDTPDQVQAAALQFRGAGVTLVLQTARGTVTDFARAAQAQNYYPKYVMMNDQSMSLVADSSTPIPTSFNGAVVITTDQEGASNTHGAVPTAATQACTKIAESVGEPPPDDQHRLAGQLDGNACAEVTALVAAISHITEPVRAGLAYGLAAAGPLDLASPAGPMDVTNAHDPTGGQEWRPAAWHTSCSCWIVTNLRWSPGWN